MLRIAFRILLTAAVFLLLDPVTGLAQQEPAPFPQHGCVRTVGAMHVLREVRSVVPEGERSPPQPQDAGWMPEALSDLAVRGQQYAMVDRNAARVTVTDSGFRNRRDFGTKGSGPGELRTPVAVAFDPRGDTLWVLDNGRHVVVAFTTSGRFVRELRVPSRARDLAVGNDGSIYVSHEFLVFNARGTVPLVTSVGRGTDDTTTVVAVTAADLTPPRFVLPGPMTIRIKSLGALIAVYYEPAGIVELYQKAGSQLKRVSTITACMPKESAAALDIQRKTHANSQSWVSLVTDVTLRGDTVYVITNRRDKNERYGIQRFLASTGADVGAIVMNAGPIKLPSELRFGSVPTDIIAFSGSDGVITRFDASRRVTR
jgi:hypothetical protein